MSETIREGDYILYFKSDLLFNEPKYNKVYLFNNPHKNSYNTDEVLIKRCIGLEGDTIVFRDTCTLRNKKVLRNPKLVRHNYKLKIIDDDFVFNKLGFIEDFIINYHRDDSTYYLNLTSLERESISKQLEDLGLSLNVDSDQPFCQNNQFHYSLKYLGVEEDVKPVRPILLTISNGVYFLGDNRPHSIDSRFFGSISDNNIKGKAVLIIFGKRKGRNVFFRRIA